MKDLFILNHPPHSTEHCYDTRRLAGALIKNDPQGDITVFLMADAVLAAKARQKTPDRYDHIERMLKLKRVLAGRGPILLCGTCMDTRRLPKPR